MSEITFAKRVADYCDDLGASILSKDEDCAEFEYENEDEVRVVIAVEFDTDRVIIELFVDPSEPIRYDFDTMDDMTKVKKILV